MSETHEYSQSTVLFLTDDAGCHTKKTRNTRSELYPYSYTILWILCATGYTMIHHFHGSRWYSQSHLNSKPQCYNLFLDQCIVEEIQRYRGWSYKWGHFCLCIFDVHTRHLVHIHILYWLHVQSSYQLSCSWSWDDERSLAWFLIFRAHFTEIKSKIAIFEDWKWFKSKSKRKRKRRDGMSVT